MYLNGYVLEYFQSHPRAMSNGCVYQHILVAEEMIGRRLTKEEVVHHKDGNRANNNMVNLMVFRSPSDHARFHRGANCIRHDDGTFSTEIPTYKCKLCGREISQGRKFCEKCLKERRRSKIMPPKEILIKELIKGNYSSVGRKYGVTPNAVKKWARKYGLI